MPGVCRIRLLGPLRVWDGAAWSPIRAAQQRVVLSILLIEAGQVVSAERLVDEIWGPSPPRAAASVLRGYVMRLRRALGIGTDGPLQTRQAGYELSIDDGDVDARVFERLVETGRHALSTGDPERAVADLSQARDLWRGAALADVPASPTVTGYADRLERARLTATEDLIAARLELGQHGEVAAELHRLVDEHPLRERLWAQLMTALYRGGRRGDALEAYRRARASLVNALGLEPGRELQELHRAILSDDRRLAVPSRLAAHTGPARIIPAHLPTDIAGFAGRDHQLKQLDALLSELAERSAPLLICLAGTAGVGKTTLAVHWAHRVAGMFPDGQLFVNLRGFDPSGSVLGVGEAIRGLLEALQVPPQQIPATVEAQVGLYRSLLAGRRMLVLLDNARDTEQVRPLLPNSPGCLALVTSRNQLTGLVAADGAHPLSLDLLTAAEARQLLERRLSPDRVVAEPEPVAEIVSRCAGLPLALAIVAARAATQPQFGLATMARQLRAAGDGLDAFAGGDASTDVRAVFSWSYRALDRSPARLFRLLALHPATDLGATAAASLAGMTPAQVRPLLAELTRAHLLSEHAAGRYGFHDLLRVYAAELGDSVDGADERRAATRRLLDHYLHTAYAAAQQQDPHQVDEDLAAGPAPGTTPERITSHDQALAWFQIEYPVLVALVGFAADCGFEAHAWQLARFLGIYLQRSANWQEWADTQRTALRAARRLGDRAAQARAHRGIARAESRRGRHSGAADHLQQALDLLAELGDQDGQAHTHLAFGLLLEKQGRHREALGHCDEALELFRVAGNRAGQGRTLNSMGWCHAMLGEYHQAITCCQQALALAEEIGDRSGQASTWHSLAYCHHHLGRHEPAVFCYRRSVDLFQQIGDRYSEATALTHLGDTYRALGQAPDAHTAWRQALAILDDLGHPDAGRVRDKLAG